MHVVNLQVAQRYTTIQIQRTESNRIGRAEIEKGQLFQTVTTAQIQRALFVPQPAEIELPDIFVKLQIRHFLAIEFQILTITYVETLEIILKRQVFQSCTSLEIGRGQEIGIGNQRIERSAILHVDRMMEPVGMRSPGIFQIIQIRELLHV